MRNALKKEIGLLIFIAGCFFIYKGLHYALVYDAQSYTRLTFHDLYQQQENIDLLFVGSSHCYRAINPAVMDRELSLNTFNAGCSSQTLDGSFMMIQEAEKNNTLKHIYLEMYYEAGTIFYPRQARQLLTQTYIISDYLKSGIEKYLYLLRASNTTHYIHSFFPMRRNWDSLYDLDWIQRNITAKDSELYKTYGSVNGYAGKGFINDLTEITDWNYFENSALFTLNLNSYTDDWREDLQNIIRFCKENHIELTLFSAPMPEYHLAQYSNYDDYITMLRELLEGTGISYWDFNLCKEEYFPSDSSFYKDDDHMNSKGAEIFSALIAGFIKGEITPEELFYDSYAEKLHHMEPNIFGVIYTIKNGEGSSTYRSCHIVSTTTEGMEYQITILPAEGEPCLIQDYAQNTVFSLTEEGAGKILINWRVKGKPENSGERIIDFPKK